MHPQAVPTGVCTDTERAKRLGRLPWLATAIVVGFLFAPLTSAWADQLRMPNLQDKLLDPFQAPQGTKAVVLVFTSTDCPISNRYAPEVRRLYDKFAARGVVFWLVYPNPAESLKTTRDHVKAYSYPMDALRDPRHALVKRARATVTPEAAVFDQNGRLLYHGRIDDRYVALGLERTAPTRRDLDEALTAVLAGTPVPQPATQAVGCFLADLLR